MNLKIVLLCLAVTLIVLTGAFLMTDTPASPAALFHTQIEPNRLPADAVILDVRTGSEHGEIALAQPHYFVELSKLDPAVFMQEHALGDKTLYILCRSGKRATKAAEMFEKAGYKNVSVITGGITNAKAQGLKMVEEKVISMERQVRITAGSLVVLGVLAGFFISPYFFVVPLFIGFGLIYAGISNSCGMAQILSMMPWNK